MRSIWIMALLLWGLGTVQAADKIKPFVLAGIQKGEIAEIVDTTKQKLTAAGFEIVGQYSPYPTATIIGVTNGALKQAAAETDFGVFGAAQRITVTKGKDGRIQVAYTNPVYMANVYHFKSDLASVAAQLKQALGYQKQYGLKEGMSAEALRDYHYKWLMPYFSDRLDLAEYSSYDAAVKGVEAALAAEKGGAKKVYRVDIPGKHASLFGVYLADKSPDECARDKYIMKRIDFNDIKSTGHLPYEIVVKDKKAYALPAEFRIAISFPDLSMMGSNSFASIMCAPSAISSALTLAAGGELRDEE